MYTYIHTYVCVYICIHIHIHSHRHIPTYKGKRGAAIAKLEGDTGASISVKDGQVGGRSRIVVSGPDEASVKRAEAMIRERIAELEKVT